MSAAKLSKSLGAATLAVTLLAAGAAGGVWWARQQHAPGTQSPAGQAEAGRKVLYWYDPMVPNQKFDRPGKSPFMDMELVPKYADDDSGGATVKIDPAVSQNLGLRLATVVRAPLETQVEATGVVGYNERDVAIVQARANGFVERVAPLAPGDVVAEGAFLAELLVPDWAAAQQEYLALLGTGDAALAAAARARLSLTGMPDTLVRAVETTRQPQPRVTVTAPRGGVIQELGVRPGMSLMAGQTLARINGIGSVWLEVAVPEAQAGHVQIGQVAKAQFAALPDQPVTGQVTALLPGLNEAARSLRVRVELPNRGGRLRPGLSAQVRLQGAAGAPTLRVPSAAVIRTGQRALVMVAEAGGRYHPVEVALGPEVGDDTVVLSGLREGQQVVASGQFLIDSEASLKGIVARQAAPAGGDHAGHGVTAKAEPLHESQGKIEELSAQEATIAHGPFQSLNMPGMTMSFPLARPELAQGLQAGDTVRFAVRQTGDGLVVEQMTRQGGGK